MSEEVNNNEGNGPEEGSETQGTEASETTMEDIARANGWKPESEWKGDPPRDGFKSAADFVKDGFKIQQTQHDKIDKLQSQLSGISEKMEQLTAGEAQRLQKALSAQADRLKAERAEAVATGDTARFNEVDEELKKAESELQDVSAQTSPDPFVEGEAPFKSKNTWFEQDKTMTAFAFNIASGLRSAYPNITADEYYAEIENAVKEQFPHKFNNPRRGDVAVDGGSQKPSSRKKGFESLPQEAKAAFEEISYYNKKLTKEKYAKAYYETGE